MVVHLDADLLVEGQVEERPQCNLKQQRIVAWYEPIQFLDDAEVFHLVLVLAENGQLLYEVQHNEQQVGVVPAKHRYEKVDDLAVLHFPLDLQVFG